MDGGTPVERGAARELPFLRASAMSSWIYSLLAEVATYAKQAVSVDVPEILELSAKVQYKDPHTR